MSENEFRGTPGPWHTEPASSGFRAPDHEDMMILNGEMICPGIVWEYGERGVANAVLICAAPDLLAALVNTADILEWTLLPFANESEAAAIRERVALARAAIAKATGTKK